MSLETYDAESAPERGATSTGDWISCRFVASGAPEGFLTFWYSTLLFIKHSTKDGGSRMRRAISSWATPRPQLSWRRYFGRRCQWSSATTGWLQYLGETRCGRVFTSWGVGGWGKRRVRCVPAETEGVVVVVARLKVRHVPRHVPWLQSLGEKRCGSVFNSKEKRRRCGVPAETGVVARLKVRHVPWLQFNS